MLLGLAGVAAESLAPSGVEARLWTIALAAGLLGIVLGLLRTPDSVSHLIAIATGIGSAVGLAALRLPHPLPDSSFTDRVSAVSTDIRDWYLGTGGQEDTSDLLVIILLQMIVWLISYLAAWSLVRRGWVTVAILLPGTVVVTARVSGDDQPEHLLEIFLVLGVMLLARATFVRRAGSGQHRVQGDRRGWGSLLTAAVVGILIVTIGAATPEDFSQDTLQPIASSATETYLQAQDQTADWIAERLDISGSNAPDIENFPRYTAFDDAFSIGGDLNLTDQPEVVVRTEGPAPYLTAQSYDLYNGRGWESTVEETFDADGPDGVRYSPELTFRPEQQVPYSGAVDEERAPVSMEVTPLTAGGETIFTNGMYFSADERASVRMSWQQFDAMRFPLREMDLSTVPPDLTGIVSLLMRASELTVEGEAGLLYPSSAMDRERLETARAQLADRFIEVTWTVAPDGGVQDMVVTGQVPVYDDNVTVKRAGEGGVNDPYVVTSLQTSAGEAELRSATTVYPDWVTSRYMQLPSAVTPRTVELANNLTVGVSNPYDQAKVIEQFLRDHIIYDIEVGLPPADRDIVDYVLFELQRGYCEHYASAMTVMLRILGIPAKTVVGYHPADYDEAYGGYLYRQENAHAWTEAFFPGYGWIRFEPTASQPASSLDGDLQPSIATPTPVPTLEPQTPVATPPASTPSVAEDVPPIADAVPETPDNGGGTAWPMLVVPALVVAAAGAALWWFLARSASLDPRSLFSSLVRWGRAGGVRGDASVTPREYARDFGQRYPDFAHDASEIVDLYEEHRYGGRVPEPSRLEQAAQALRHLRRELIRRVVRFGR